MNDLYLVAHVVRGEPAFDIAAQIEIGDEIAWIIPTSGHRAYPYWTKRFDRIACEGWLAIYGDPWRDLPPVPADLPDHYASTPAPPGRGIADLSFLKPKLPAITRRV